MGASGRNAATSGSRIRATSTGSAVRAGRRPAIATIGVIRKSLTGIQTVSSLPRTSTPAAAASSNRMRQPVAASVLERPAFALGPFLDVGKVEWRALTAPTAAPGTDRPTDPGRRPRVSPIRAVDRHRRVGRGEDDRSADDVGVADHRVARPELALEQCPGKGVLDQPLDRPL